MKRCKTMFPGGLNGVVLAGLVVAVAAVVCGPSAAADTSILVGNGHSISTDAKTAGAEAAGKAKAALGDAEAKLVLVFDSVDGGIEGKKAMLQGVGSVFDASIVYGCAAYAPLTQDSNTGTVGVLALGGNVQATAALADLQGGHEACGRKIGQALKKVKPSESTGRLVLLFGACHVPANDDLVRGLTGVLGEKFPVAGGAAKGDLLYYQGKVLPKSNLGLLLSGDFQCGFSAKNAPGGQKERVIAVAGEAAEQAVGPNKDRATLVLAFDCGGRRSQMAGVLDKELRAMRDAIGNAPLFGFYGSGETGPKDNDSPPRGVGYHIVICAILEQ